MYFTPTTGGTMEPEKAELSESEMRNQMEAAATGALGLSMFVVILLLLYVIGAFIAYSHAIWCAGRTKTTFPSALGSFILVGLFWPLHFIYYGLMKSGGYCQD